MNTNVLAAALAGFMLGGLTVSVADSLESEGSGSSSHGSHPAVVSVQHSDRSQ